MKQEFDFDQIGKRMPYTLPDGFFEEMEGKVLSRVNAGQEKKNGTKMLSLRRVMLAVSAAACLLFAFTFLLPKPYSAEEADAQEITAFEGLSAEDQGFLLEVYDDDIFINDFYSE